MHGTPCALSSPVTGRNGLQIGRHAFGIPGLTDAQSDELLSWLLRFAADEPSRVYYHQWEVGDLVVRFKGNTQFGLSAWSHLLALGAGVGQPTDAAPSVPLPS